MVEAIIRSGEGSIPTAMPDLTLLPAIFEPYTEIQAVYVFGSVDAGNTNAENDLDLAIVPRPDAGSLPRLDILADLARNGFCDVDLVILDTEDIVLMHEAIRQNRLIYQTEDFDRGAYYPMVRTEVIQKRLRKLDEYLAILKGLRHYSQEEFTSNPERHGSAERFLQLSIESITEMGNHVIADLVLGKVDW